MKCCPNFNPSLFLFFVFQIFTTNRKSISCMYILNKELFFPPVKFADEDGLLAIGGDLSSERLLLAYKSGIFPWYNEHDPICWYCPDPRFVLFPQELNISKSMRSIINSGIFSFTVSMAFNEVIKNCKNRDECNCKDYEHRHPVFLQDGRNTGQVFSQDHNRRCNKCSNKSECPGGWIFHGVKVTTLSVNRYS